MLELHARDPQISVFRLEADDWLTARELRLQALRDSPDAFLGGMTAEGEYDEKHWRGELELNVWFVARLDSEPVGLAKLNRSPEEDDGMHLEAMWVAPAARLRGVGEVLVAAVESTATALGAQLLRLWVFAEIQSAHTFYRQLGYTGPVRRQAIKVNDRVRIEEEYEKHLG
ncbi:GNAT family N-acetyltransferase [Kribbella sp. NPDC056345]|uniref:GNAT family N-acetyltransferase n=1 Tax=Kribbella sp. NPDC056345 TaxID=3345789 RepID=UPI0035D695BD